MIGCGFISCPQTIKFLPVSVMWLDATETIDISLSSTAL
jgi:hypothetical protein